MKNSLSPQKKEHSIWYALDHPERALKELAQELGVWLLKPAKVGQAG